MWDIKQNSCVILNTDHYTTDWVINPTNRPIDIFTTTFPPLLTYEDWEVNTTVKGVDNNTVLYYQYCGPFVVLLRTFAQYLRTNFKIGRQYSSAIDIADNYREMAESLLSYPKLILIPAPYKMFSTVFMVDVWYNLSRFIGPLYGDIIISKMHLVPRSVFEFIDCWDHNIYLWLILSLISIAAVFGVKYRSMNTSLQSVWAYISVILSDSMQIKRKESLMERLFAGLWLMICGTLLLSLYSGFIYDKLMSADNYDKVEGKWDLYDKSHWKGSIIYGFNYDMHGYMLEQGPQYDPMALDFISRAYICDLLQLLYDIDYQIEIIAQIFENNSVMTAPGLLGYYVVNRVGNYFINHPGHKYYDTAIKWSQRGLESVQIYIPDTSNDSVLYFMAVQSELLDDFNHVVTVLQESGVYEYETQKSLKPKGYGRDITKIENVQVNSDDMSIYSLSGTFWLLLSGIFVSLIVFIIEIIHNKRSYIKRYIFY